MELEEYDRLYALEEEHWRFRALRRLLGAALRRHLAGVASPRILDAGCGCGGTLRSLLDLGRPVGVDLHPRALAWARRRGLPALVRAGVERLPFADASFDAVVSVDVLYHRAVADDAAALAEIARVCRPGGVALLWLPAYDWMRSSHDAAVHGVRRYTRRRLLALARAAGLAVERASYAHMPLLPVAAARRLLPRPRAGAELAPTPRPLAAALEALLAAEGALLLRAPLPFGLSLFAVLRRPSTGS